MTIKDAPVGSPHTAEIRKEIYRKFPEEYKLGAHQGMEAIDEYPPEFHWPWTKDQRNAWFAGYNAGRARRLSRLPAQQQTDKLKD